MLRELDNGPKDVPRFEADIALRLGARVGGGGASVEAASTFFFETIIRDGRRLIFASN